jgi:hypothetical protein
VGGGGDVGGGGVEPPPPPPQAANMAAISARPGREILENIVSIKVKACSNAEYSTCEYIIKTLSNA